MHETESPAPGPELDRVQQAYVAYNQAYRHRHDEAAAPALRQARLDLLLALALEDPDLAPALIEQVSQDALFVLDLDARDPETASHPTL